MNRNRPLLYSSGNFAASLIGSVFSTYVMFFYVDVLKVPAHLIGLAMGIYGIWNAINDPLLGQISDRTRSKWGRRIPYILFGLVPFILFFTLVWTPPLKLLGGNVYSLLGYFIVMIFLFDTLYTLVVINWTALFPEMYKTQEERTRVSVFRQIFGIIGNILGVALPPVIYAAIGWPAMGIGFGLLSLIFMGLSLMGSKEDPSYSEGAGLSLGASLKATFANKSFLTYVIGSMFLQFTFVMLQAVLPFYAKYNLKVTGFKVSILLGIIFIMAIFFVNLWGKRANKAGSRNTIILATILYGLALIPFWFVKSYIGAVITAGLLGVGLAGLIVLLDVLLSDVIDEDELKTGTRREGMYFGINGFMVRIGISLQSVIMGSVLSLSGYNAKLPVEAQSAGTFLGIKFLLVVIPLVSLVFAILFYRLYPLHGAKLRAVKEKLLSIHDKSIRG